MALRPLDLARTAVFVDFDGTVSTTDVGQHLLARFVGPEWRDLHLAYERGEIGSRECLFDQWELVPRSVGESELRAAAREVPLDAGAGDLLAGLRRAGAEVTVVSDGFGFYVEEACAPLAVAVLTNRIDFATRRLEFPHEDRCCPCSSCGVCKQAPIKDARRRGLTTVLVGDGVSDRKAAFLADVVFAKAGLATWCEASGVPCTRFDTLADVAAELLP